MNFLKSGILAALALGILGTSNAYALERRQITIKPDTNYQQTVWTAIQMGRVYSANVLPANPTAAMALAQLSFRHSYTCEAEFYLGSIGYFGRDGERSVMMLYRLVGCQPH